MEESALFNLWSKAVGPQIAQQTHPDRLHSGTLFVSTASSVWVLQLHFMKKEIQQKLNQLAGKTVVRDIHFTVGYQPSKGKCDATMILNDRDRRMIDESTEKLPDPELASIVKRVMEKEISRRRSLETKTGR